MKKLSIVLTIALVSLLSLLSCNDLISVSENSKGLENSRNSEGATLFISFNSENSRTALPTVNWDNYKYQLVAVENYGEANQKNPVTVVENSEKVALAQGVTLNKSKYHLVLNASNSGTNIFSGSADADLTDGNKSVSFKMHPVSGSTGSAEIVVTFPKTDSPVKKVVAQFSKDIFAAEKDSEVLEITEAAGEYKVIFSKDNLESAQNLFALFWFYDAQNQLVLSMAESVVVAGGCISTSTVALTNSDWHSYAVALTLRQNEKKWANTGKKVSLADKNNPENVYALREQSGVFYGSVADSVYNILIDGVNTGLEFNSAEKAYNIDYYTLSIETTKSVTFVPLNEGISLLEIDSDYVYELKNESGTTHFTYIADVLKGTDLRYKLVRSRGYSDSGVSYKLNGSDITGATFDRELRVDNVSSELKFSITGLSPIQYTITYQIDSSTDKWVSGYTAPTTFTLDDPAELPTMANIRKNGKVFDIWVLASDESVAVKSTEDFFENIVLKPRWKDSAYADSLNKTIYANGISLIITEHTDTISKITTTDVYVDFDSDGVIDAEDVQLDDGNGNYDFTGYILRAGNDKGDSFDSDFTFTMTGGTISEIWGLDSRDDKHSNKSILNISGSAKIGSADGIYKVDNGNGTYKSVTENAHGVMLETITNEWVMIVGQMTGDYSVVCITPHFYDENKERFISYIGNSNWASMNKFICFTETEDKDGNTIYEKDMIAMKKVRENGITRTIIRLSDPDGISLPPLDEITGDVLTGFTLGEDRVTTECSVFSIAVENGYFFIDRATLTNPAAPAPEIESRLTYLVQPDPTSYEEKITPNTGYVYMHILSKAPASSSGDDAYSDQITPEMASEFLSHITFKRADSDTKIKVKVNLETVPSTMIRDAEVSYFNGSFYKGVGYTGTKKWSDSYTAAKETVFNGMHGYLMTISSLVENNYIFQRLKLGACWMGAARIENANGLDASTYTIKASAGVDNWSWQCGPEAGTVFWTSKTYGTEKTATNFLVRKDDGTFVYQNWSNSFLGQGSGKEPNNSSTETCVQYLSNGLWNDLADGSSTPKGYIIEYTPYETEYGSEHANYQAITKEASY